MDSGADAGDRSGPLALEPIEWEGEPTLVTGMKFVPGTMEVLVLEKEGRVLHLVIEGERAGLLGSFEPIPVYSDMACGLISLTFDTEFDANGFIYLGSCVDGQTSAIHRVVFDPADYGGIAETAEVIVTVGDERAERPWHNVGSIGFEPSGVLWALFGDKAVDANGQSRDDDLGALVRIIPSRDPAEGGHVPAPDNPWIGGGGSPDVYAYGLRSPWRGILDLAGRWWIGDVGAETWEEVNLVTEPAQNFGWSSVEGPCAEACEGLTDPILAWERGGDERYIGEDPEAEDIGSRVVWVGPEVRDVGVDPYGGRLTGAVLFGDMCVGFARVAAVDGEGRVVRDEPLGHMAGFATLEQAVDGYLYGTTYGGCLGTVEDEVSRLYRLRLE